MNSPCQLPNTTGQAQRLLMAAKTAISLIENMHALIWDLYADEILAIKQDEEQKIIELLAMALVDQAWPLDDTDEMPGFDKRENVDFEQP